MVLGDGLKGFAGVGHLFDGHVKIGVQFEAHSHIHGGAQPAGFVGMRFGGGQAKDIRGELHGGRALTAAARDANLGDGNFCTFLGAFHAFAQGVGQAFQNGAVHVGAGMHIAKADDGALGFRTWHFETR
ncbi:hypothetical protein SDC9_113960 [bioreactor metagenome]|uniref:Uncharacterized protein n=1 Tax=bioreactor metagenome TaxID=1076179 RepID=A0A645BZA5_9ZZZZ